jgi:hypothetical protein
MKILIFNPLLGPTHEVSKRLTQLGAALLYPSDTDEIWKMVQLHGASLDLVIIHREPASGPGRSARAELNLGVLQKIKAVRAYVDLPVIVTSSVWGDNEFAHHQEGKAGAHAYLHWPCSADDLIKTIETMFGSAVEWSNQLQESAEVSHFILEEVLKPEEVSKGISLVFEVPAKAPPPQAETGLEARNKADPLLATNFLPISEPTTIQSGFSLAPLEEELEPHERLMLANAPKPSAPRPSAASSLSLSKPDSPPSMQFLEGPVPEGGTEVLGLVPESNSTAFVSPDQAASLLTTMSPEPVPFELPEHSGISISMNPREPSHVTQPAPLVSPSMPPVLPMAPVPEESEEALAANLPYLFKRSGAPSASAVSPVMMFAEPVGDAVVPGGAVNAPDVDILKKYLLLREQDVAVLSNQLKASREQLLAFDKKLKEANGQILELRHVVGEQERRLADGDRDQRFALESLQKENEELRFQAKVKTDRVRVMEAQVREATDEIERLKERVRTDIRKIRVREKELENKLEIMRRDSEALIAARETKIIELKRKVDLLEFNIDLLQDQYSREKDGSAQLRERLGKAAQVVRVAGGLLDSPSKDSSQGSDRVSGNGSGESGSYSSNSIGENESGARVREVETA